MKSNIYNNTWYNPTKKELKDSNITATVAFDLDSVLSDMSAILEEGICNTFNVPTCRAFHPTDGYRLFSYHVPNTTDDEIGNAIERAIIEHSLQAPPTPYMSEVLRYIYEVTGQPITVVTARSKDTMTETYKWLLHNIPKDVTFNLFMTQGMPKAEVLKLINNLVFVDDRYKTVDTLQATNKGLAVLYKRPWNQNRKVEAGDFSIVDLRELIPIINFIVRRPIFDWPDDLNFPGERERLIQKGEITIA